MNCKRHAVVCAVVWAALVLATSARGATIGLKIARVNDLPVPDGPVSSVQVAPGNTLTVEAFLAGWSPDLLRAYQLQLDPAGYTSGGAGMLVPQPGGAFIDAARLDFAFAGMSVDPADEAAVAVVDAAAPAVRWGAALFDKAASIPDTGEVYLATLELEVSADAAGTFTLGLDAGGTFLRDGATPPGAILPLNLAAATIVVEAACAVAADCGDVDGDSVRDDACSWYACSGGACDVVAKTTQADLGGFNGACPPDTACDGNDRFHALNCFSDLTTQGAPGYPCEPSPPAALNVDAGGPASCALDGVCDGNDAFHALNCFENDWFDGSIGYQCTCPGAPAALLPPPVAATEHTGLILKGPAVAAPGEIVEVEVYLQDALTALRGYQLHLQARTGKAGVLQLLDIGVDRARPDYAFATVPGAWSAFNRDVAQMVVGMDAPEGRPVPAGAYLATFTYRIPKDAAGTFAIEVLHDPAGESREQRTFLFGESARLIAIGPLTAATITVSGSEPPTRSRNP
jgi:hypothetical protein